MKLQIICPACKKEFRFTDRNSSGTVSCPHCGDQVSKDLGTVVDEKGAQVTRFKSNPGADMPTRSCPHCGKSIPIQARKCKYCRTWLDEEEQPAEVYSDYVPCPRCGARGAERVVFTFWGSFYGPALFTHVQCPKCYYKYNGKTGRSNWLPATLFVTIPLVLILAIIGGVAFLAYKLSRGP